MTDITLPRDLAYTRDEPHGLAAWLTGTDHKHVGLQYMAFLVGVGPGRRNS